MGISPLVLRPLLFNHSFPPTCLRMRAFGFWSLRRAFAFRPSWSRYSRIAAPSHGIALDLVRPAQRRSPSSCRHFSASSSFRFSLEADSTIYALSTAPGRAAIAVVRVSGSACVQVGQSSQLFQSATDTNFPTS
jgi:hypothetical protein